MTRLPSYSRPRTPVAVLETLRLLVVVFFAGAGYQLGAGTATGAPVLGPLNGTALGLVLGSGLGYVLGGVLGRRAGTAAEATRSRLYEISADQLVAGALGTVGGVLLGAGVAWPVFLLPQSALAFPLFGFVVVALGYLGFSVGASKREGVLAMFGQRVGIAPRPLPAAARTCVLDSSVAIDGRVLQVVRAGFLHGRMLVPAPVLAELQGLADAADDLRRGRGRRGLELLETLRREPDVDLEVLEVDVPAAHEVDAKLVRICLDRAAALLTLDTNLAKAAGLAGVAVLNLHALALALRPPVTAGDAVRVLLQKPGKEPGQAVGYLDDGTMVVAQRAREHVGGEVEVTVTSVLTTANGRLVFAQLAAPKARPATAPSAGPVIPAPGMLPAAPPQRRAAGVPAAARPGRPGP